MTDIVNRLRAMPSSLNDAMRTMDMAAAEIERLQAELRRSHHTHAKESRMTYRPADFWIGLSGAILLTLAGGGLITFIAVLAVETAGR